MTVTVSNAIARRPVSYSQVDVAFVVESTYPYLRGGLSAVVHDIVQAHPDKSIGIIHITWDSSSPQEDVYGMPSHVRWVFPVYLSMNEHIDDFRALSPSVLRTGSAGRRSLARQLFGALHAAVARQDYTDLWRLYDDGMNPYTRHYTLWPLIKTKEFLTEARHQLRQLDISLTDLFWLLREFFSLACAVMGPVYPRAKVYHAHTTGYAALASAVAARQYGSSFLLTEHNLYTRDTINTLLGTGMNHVVRAGDWRTTRGISVKQRAWMAWWIEMGRLAYHAADKITYLYPDAIEEARGLGTILHKAQVIPNGMPIEDFDPAHRRFRQLSAQRDNQQEPWRLAYAARLVPIKGLLTLLEAIAQLRVSGDIYFTLDVMGHAEEVPDYAEQCRRRCAELGLDDIVTFVGNQNLREVLAHYDLLVLPSYNEGLPIVVLEAMAVGLPIIGTRVGGMSQVIESRIAGSGDDRCGVLVEPGDSRAFARALHHVLSKPGFYQYLQSNARNRVLASFRLDQAMSAYRRVYHQLTARDSPAGVPAVSGRVALPQPPRPARFPSPDERKPLPVLRPLNSDQARILQRRR